MKNTRFFVVMFLALVMLGMVSCGDDDPVVYQYNLIRDPNTNWGISIGKITYWMDSVGYDYMYTDTAADGNIYEYYYGLDRESMVVVGIDSLNYTTGPKYFYTSAAYYFDSNTTDKEEVRGFLEERCYLIRILNSGATKYVTEDKKSVALLYNANYEGKYYYVIEYNSGSRYFRFY